MSCAAPIIIVGGVPISTNDFENAKELLEVSGDNGDPTADAYDESIAGGNNNKNAAGVQFPASEQTTAPPAINVPADQSVESKPATNNGSPVSCSVWSGDYDYQLSPNFKVRDFTVNALFKNQLNDFQSYTASVRCCNLQNLALNIAEPLRAKFGAFSINSGIRNQNSVTFPGVSQHVLGQAMDVQFAGWTYDRYWENAQWVKDNLPYDQFIFEHSDKTGLAWFHLSYNAAGNRASSERTKVMTMYRNKYDSGLKRYS
jgi:zinc D-Ala-D-Ala carboxypeptidase